MTATVTRLGECSWGVLSVLSDGAGVSLLALLVGVGFALVVLEAVDDVEEAREVDEPEALSEPVEEALVADDCGDGSIDKERKSTRYSTYV